MKTIFFLFVLFVGFSAFAQSQGPKSSDKIVSAVSSLNLRPDEVIKLSEDGWNGAGEAALRLSMYYASVKLDLDRSDYWMTIAAENGNAVAQYNVWARLSESSNADDKKRAIFWLRKSAMQGDPDARLELQKIEKSMSPG
ncbi:TPR repeat protein [Dyella sp. SG562]|uniref:tetratricopeptide repeat protein n=1 Tax=Dyella sp. SG562 TaxID=2587017 RepID=UPI00141DD26F|nr:sel1 repeat family protein [Dyella sp. SG562]NII72722.1 TPR repeat protein [Dyella sp. SG562]